MNIGVNNCSRKNQDEREENAKSSQRTENSLARTKLYAGEEYLDWWPGAEGRKPPIPVLLWLTDGQKSFLKRRRKKKKNSSNTHGLISIVLLLQKMKQQLCEMWFRNSSSCLLLSILTMWIVLDVDLSFPQAGKELYFPFGACSPSKTAPSYISMNNDFID